MAEEEIFDIVDENDRVIGNQPRDVVHEQGLRHRAVHMLVYNERDELYVQKRSAVKDTNPNLWDTSAAGHLESGETYDAAAQRELGEELGLATVPPLRRLFKLSASERTGNEFIWVYRCVTNDEIYPDRTEISEGRWLTALQLSQWVERKPIEFTSVFVDIISRIQGERGSGYVPA